MKAKLATETPAARYRRIKAERAAKEETFDFESPSGMVWKLRRPNLLQYAATGQMPVGLVVKMAQSTPEEQESGTPFLTLDGQEQLKTIEFASKLVQYCAVSPRIVEVPQNDDEIAYSEVELDDYNAILQWAVAGGGEAVNLDSFHQQP